MPLLLYMLLVGVPGTNDLPVYFGRSGTQAVVAVEAADGCLITVAVMDLPIVADVVVAEGAIAFTVPDVRARTVLEIRHRKRCLARLAAYPQRSQLWSDTDIQVVSMGVPRWFGAWASAVGVDVIACSSLAMLRQIELSPAQHRLIVVGRAARLPDLHAALDLADAFGSHLLVLDAPWFGEHERESVDMRLAKTPSPLDGLASWSWRDLPGFPYYWRPKPEVLNRLAVAEAGGHVLIECFLRPAASHMVVASYVTWHRQIGLNDAADTFLVALMRETARAKRPDLSEATVVVSGGGASWPDEDRPVLSRVPHVTDTRAHQAPLQVIDLRGESPAPVSRRHLQRVMVEKSAPPWIVLGDDPVLDTLRGFNREKERQCIPADRRWWPNDDLPPSAESQEVLMRTLTLRGIVINSNLEADR